jgi:hypothetical protein
VVGVGGQLTPGGDIIVTASSGTTQNYEDTLTGWGTELNVGGARVSFGEGASTIEASVEWHLTGARALIPVPSATIQYGFEIQPIQTPDSPYLPLGEATGSRAMDSLNEVFRRFFDREYQPDFDRVE